MLFLGNSAAECRCICVCLCVFSMTDWIQTHICQVLHNETEKLRYTVVPSACLGSAATIFRIPYLQVGNCSPAQDFIFLLWVFKPNIKLAVWMGEQVWEKKWGYIQIQWCCISSKYKVYMLHDYLQEDSITDAVSCLKSEKLIIWPGKGAFSDLGNTEYRVNLSIWEPFVLATKIFGSGSTMMLSTKMWVTVSDFQSRILWKDTSSHGSILHSSQISLEYQQVPTPGQQYSLFEDSVKNSLLCSLNYTDKNTKHARDEMLMCTYQFYSYIFIGV